MEDTTSTGTQMMCEDATTQLLAAYRAALAVTGDVVTRRAGEGLSPASLDRHQTGANYPSVALLTPARWPAVPGASICARDVLHDSWARLPAVKVPE